ncbi:MAG: CoA transferase [Dehalococcoidia bacterium]
MHALENVRVLDMGDFLAGPLGPQLLADLGAEVIKLERATGDPMRGVWAFFGCQRGKRAIAVDLYSDEGRQVCYKLIERVDIVHQNWRPGVAQRLKVDYETVRRYNPDVVYCHNVPFGFDGPRAHRGGLDQIMQAYCGTLERVSGEGNPPTTWVKTGLCDYVQAMMGGVSMLMGLYHKARTGKGQFVGSRMIDAGLFIHSDVVLGPEGTPQPPRLDRQCQGFGPLYRLYETKDGWICIVVVREGHWQRLCQALGASELAADARFATAVDRQKNADALTRLLEERFLSKTADEWFEELDRNGVPCEVSKLHYGHEGEDFPDHPDVVANGWSVRYRHSVLGEMWQTGLPFSLSKTPGKIWGPPPALGEHTR